MMVALIADAFHYVRQMVSVELRGLTTVAKRLDWDRSRIGRADGSFLSRTYTEIHDILRCAIGIRAH